MWQKQEHDVDLGLTNLLTTRQLVKGKDVQPTVFNHLKLPIIILQSASAILITCYFELSLSRSFSLVPSEVSVTALITSFGAMNHHYLNISPCRAIYLVHSRLFMTFFINFLECFYFTHIQMLKEYIWKPRSNVKLFLFRAQQGVKKIPGFERLRK